MCKKSVPLVIVVELVKNINFLRLGERISDVLSMKMACFWHYEKDPVKGRSRLCLSLTRDGASYEKAAASIVQ